MNWILIVSFFITPKLSGSGFRVPGSEVAIT
jgi:hypothetical protein